MNNTIFKFVMKHMSKTTIRMIIAGGAVGVGVGMMSESHDMSPKTKAELQVAGTVAIAAGSYIAGMHTYPEHMAKELEKANAKAGKDALVAITCHFTKEDAGVFKDFDIVPAGVLENLLGESLKAPLK